MTAVQAPLPGINFANKLWFMDGNPMEYPAGGCGDFRQHCIEIETKEGYTALEPIYVSHSISKGKPKLEGLPRHLQMMTSAALLRLCFQINLPV